MTPTPPLSEFTPRERRLIGRLRTPSEVQVYLNALPYNTEPGGATLRSFRRVVDAGTAHCFEAAMFACVVLEQHGYPPLVLSFESIDGPITMFVPPQRALGSVARSRDPGLHGRKPVFATRVRWHCRCGRLRRLHGRREGLRDCRHAQRRGLQLALLSAKRVEGREATCWIPTPHDPPVTGAHRRAARALRRVPGDARDQAGGLRASRSLDAHSERVPEGGRAAVAGPAWRARRDVGESLARPPNRDRSRAPGA